MAWAMTVATAAPRIPMLRIVMHTISRTILMMDEQNNTIKGRKLSPIARSMPAPKL